jgi:hypothetical protein
VVSEGIREGEEAKKAEKAAEKGKAKAKPSELAQEAQEVRSETEDGDKELEEVGGGENGSEGGAVDAEKLLESEE